MNDITMACNMYFQIYIESMDCYNRQTGAENYQNWAKICVFPMF